MTISFKLLVGLGESSARFEGWGCDGRRYAIHPCAGHYAACLIAGMGQPITATGRSPMEALQRAETAQETLAPGRGEAAAPGTDGRTDSS